MNIRPRLPVVKLFAVGVLALSFAASSLAGENAKERACTIETIVGSGSPDDNGPTAPRELRISINRLDWSLVPIAPVYLRTRSAPHPPLGSADERTIDVRGNGH